MKKKSIIFINSLVIMIAFSMFTNSCTKKDDNNNNNPIPTGQLPVLTTSAVSNITNTAAACGGNITSQGASTVTARGVCWNTVQNPTTANGHTSDSSGTGSFTSSITGLTANTLYYVRAYATNGAGTAYGNSVSFTTIGNPGGQPCPGIPTVAYGGQTYNTVQIGTQCWFKENLNIGARIDGSQPQLDNGIIEKYCYNDSTAYCDKYGGLYNWSEMLSLCPSGWHAPSDSDWTKLTDFLGGVTMAGGKMKETGTVHWVSPNYGATNESGFTALPSGTRDYNGQFHYGLFVAYFGSTTPYDVSQAWYRSINNTGASINRAYGVGKSAGLSVRCVKN